MEQKFQWVLYYALLHTAAALQNLIGEPEKYTVFRKIKSCFNGLKQISKTKPN